MYNSSELGLSTWAVSSRLQVSALSRPLLPKSPGTGAPHGEATGGSDRSTGPRSHRTNRTEGVIGSRCGWVIDSDPEILGDIPLLSVLGRSPYLKTHP